MFASKLKASAEALTRKDKEMNKFASFAVDVSNATSLLLINRKQIVTSSLLAHIGCWRYRYFKGTGSSTCFMISYIIRTYFHRFVNVSGS